MVLLAVSFLIVPIVILFITESRSTRIGIIGGFSLLFALVVALGTQSRNHDIFVTLAA